MPGRAMLTRKHYALQVQGEMDTTAVGYQVVQNADLNLGSMLT